MVNIPSISNKRKKTKNNPELNILPELESFLRPFCFIRLSCMRCSLAFFSSMVGCFGVFIFGV